MTRVTSALTRRACLGVALMLPLLSGCAIVPKLEAPKLSVISLRMQSADIFSQRLQVRMRVSNPNARELPVEGIRFRIEVNGTELGQGLMNAPFTVPALGEAEFDTQVTANVAGALVRLLTRRDSRESIDYRLVGDVSLSSGILRRIPFDERGSVKL
jgi:LEA14-like dessication related protein